MVRPAALSGDTLLVAFSDGNSPASPGASDVVLEVLRRAFPATTIRETPEFDAYSAPVGKLSLRLSFATTAEFRAPRWHGRTDIDILAIDRRRRDAVALWTRVNGTASRMNVWGYRSRDQAARASRDSVLPALIGQVDSVARGIHARAGTFVIRATPEEYAAYDGNGTATISGQAFLVTRGGDVKRGAGRLVTLDPVTSYSRSWYGSYGGALLPELFEAVPPDTLFARARRTTTSDAEGRFRFTNLQPGAYIVRTIITWEVPGTRPLPVLEREGGVVSEVVEVKGGELNEVILSRLGPRPLR